MLNGYFGENANWYPSYEEVAEQFPTLEVQAIESLVNKIDLASFKLPPYPFQVVGAAFLLDMKYAILADEMGLGKTAQAVLAASHLINTGQASRFLVICPSSIKYEWVTQIQKFTDLTSTVIDGTPKERTEQYANNSSFVITNYELARQDFDLEFLKDLKPDVIILDEAHRIKNWESKTSEKLKELSAPYKWLLTGTPLQNKPEELFNLFSFMNPEVLGKWWTFRHRYIVLGRKFGRDNIPVGAKNLDELRRRTSPYILRRLKSEVAPQLPKIVVTNHFIPMTEIQEAMHNEIRADMRDLIDVLRQWKGDTPHPKEGQLLGMVTMLTEVCDSPELFDLSNSKMASKYRARSKVSPKLDELHQICSDLLDGNPEIKIVVFTQFERMQRLIVDKLSKLGDCAILNGQMKPFERQAELDRFRFGPNVRFFVSTDAGNYGINLQQASVVVNFDIPWNPAIWLQRNARIHRIDSTHETVYVINLIAKEGIDERILDVMYNKIELSNAVIEKTEDERAMVSRLTSSVIDKLTKPSKKKKA